MAFADCASIVLKGIMMDCSNSIGGIKRVWLARYSDIASVTIGDITESGSSSVVLGKGVTAISLKSGGE
jgi:hypothetical protein